MRFGFSALHGGHHEAQKSRSTILPLVDESFIVSPSGVGRDISGASEFSPDTGAISFLELRQ